MSAYGGRDRPSAVQGCADQGLSAYLRGALAAAATHYGSLSDPGYGVLFSSREKKGGRERRILVFLYYSDSTPRTVFMMIG